MRRRQRGAATLPGRLERAPALGHRDPGALLAWLLAITVHVALLTVLVFGIRWRTKPEPVMAELWSQLPAIEQPKPLPVVKPKPEPKPEPKPAPSPKPEPKVEPKPAPKPDIALEQERKRKEAEALKLREEAERKEAEARKAREEAERKKQEELRAKQERERREREAAEKRKLEQETRDRLQEQLNRELAAAPKAPTTGPPLLGDPNARAQWSDRIRAKIRANIVVPPDIVGNPEAVFDVQLLPTGEVLSAKLRKSSGVRTYDDAVERAILKSSPLPLPAQREVFEARLELRFRPRD